MVVSEELRARYADQAARLLPPGVAWTRDAESRLRALLEGLAAAYGNVHERALDLVDEADPRTALELLADWERFLGLPDPCETIAPTTVLRRAAIVAKLTGVGGQTPAHFVALAQALGYDVEIGDVEEFTPFRVGVGRCGDRIWGIDWAHAWRVHASEATPTFFRAGEASAGDPLVQHSNDLLECYFELAKPAHTEVLFAYDRPWTGYAPWTEHFPDAAAIVVGAPDVLRTP